MKTFKNYIVEQIVFKEDIVSLLEASITKSSYGPGRQVVPRKKRCWEDFFQKNTAARARTSARLMGTRLQRQSQPISDSGERGVTQKHCLPVGCLGYSASVDTVAAISFSGAGVRNHCGRLGVLDAQSL